MTILFKLSMIDSYYYIYVKYYFRNSIICDVTYHLVNLHAWF